MTTPQTDPLRLRAQAYDARAAALKPLLDTTAPMLARLKGRADQAQNLFSHRRAQLAALAAKINDAKAASSQGGEAPLPASLALELENLDTAFDVTAILSDVVALFDKDSAEIADVFAKVDSESAWLSQEKAAIYAELDVVKAKLEALLKVEEIKDRHFGSRANALATQILASLGQQSPPKPATAALTQEVK